MLTPSIFPHNSFTYRRGVLINYEVYGSGKTSLVFLHGFGSSLNTWRDIVKLFPQDQYRLYLLDLKGFGFSSKTRDGKYGIKDQADIVLKFIEDNSVKGAVLVGHGYGGAVALLAQIIATDYNKGSLIKKLVLIDCAAYMDSQPFYIRYLQIPVVNFLIMHLTTARLKAKFLFNRMFYEKEKITESKIGCYARFLKSSVSGYSFIQAAGQIIPDDYYELTGRYRDIKTPALIIWGRYDLIYYLANGMRLNGEMADSKLTIIEECGHVPHEEQPEKTFLAIYGFTCGR